MSQQGTPFFPSARADLPRRTPPRLMPVLALVAMALGIGLTLFGTVLIVSNSSADDDIWAQVPVDGAEHRVDVPADWAAMIWAPDTSQVSCEITDAHGAKVGSTSVSGFENTVDGVSYRGVSRFVTTTDEMVFSCTSSAQGSGPVLVGQPPYLWDTLYRLAGFLPGIVVFACGIVVTGFTFATGVASIANLRRRQ